MKKRDSKIKSVNPGFRTVTVIQTKFKGIPIKIKRPEQENRTEINGYFFLPENNEEKRN